MYLQRKRTLQSGPKQKTQTATAEKRRDRNVGHATPGTPACRAKIPIAFPMTLMMFAMTEIFSVTDVFETLRQTAAPAL